MRIDLDKLEELGGKFSRVYGVDELALDDREVRLIDAAVVHAGSGTRWYCWPKKFPNRSPCFNGHTTLPCRGNAPTISGVPRL